MKISINEISKLSGATRETVAKRLQGRPFEAGPKQAKLYDFNQVFTWKSVDGSEMPVITEAESRRLLNLEKIEGEKLNNEKLRRERIPLEIIEARNDAALTNIAGIIKAHEGKILDPLLISDIFTEMRGINLDLGK